MEVNDNWVTDTDEAQSTPRHIPRPSVACSALAIVCSILAGISLFVLLYLWLAQSSAATITFATAVFGSLAGIALVFQLYALHLRNQECANDMLHNIETLLIKSDKNSIIQRDMEG